MTPDQARQEAFKGFAYFRRVLSTDEPLDPEMRDTLIRFINATEDHLRVMWALLGKGKV